ncbi:MAG: hypothetical protein RIT43_916 [Bacteroidota bacterium]|jgi:hypothetical protein
MGLNVSPIFFDISHYNAGLDTILFHKITRPALILTLAMLSASP